MLEFEKFENLELKKKSFFADFNILLVFPNSFDFFLIFTSFFSRIFSLFRQIPSYFPNTQMH